MSVERLGCIAVDIANIALRLFFHILRCLPSIHNYCTKYFSFSNRFHSFGPTKRKRQTHTRNLVFLCWMSQKDWVTNGTALLAFVLIPLYFSVSCSMVIVLGCEYHDNWYIDKYQTPLNYQNIVTINIFQHDCYFYIYTNELILKISLDGDT